MNKRGISPIIGVSLITLAAIIGVALLWAFISRNIDNAQNEVTDPDCLTIDLEVVSCTAFGTCGYQDGANYYEADLIVKRNVGKGNVTGLRFIFDDMNGVSGTADREINSSLNELGSISFTEPYAGIPIPVNPYVVKVAALIGADKDVCPIASTVVSCPIITGNLPIGNASNYSYAPGGSTPFTYNRRAGNCCQFPTNTSECYIGGDPNYLFNSMGQLVNPSGQQTGLPPGNTTICCQYNPYNGGFI